MSDRLSKLDAVSASLVSAYAREGIFAAVVRVMRGTDNDVRVISVRTDIPKLSEFLHLAADVIFDGPGTIVERQINVGPTQNQPPPESIDGQCDALLPPGTPPIARTDD